LFSGCGVGNGFFGNGLFGNCGGVLGGGPGCGGVLGGGPGCGTVVGGGAGCGGGGVVVPDATRFGTTGQRQRNGVSGVGDRRSQSRTPNRLNTQGSSRGVGQQNRRRS